MSEPEAPLALQPFLDEWRSHPEVLGVLLSGSRGAGCADDQSDYDLIIVLANEPTVSATPAVPLPQAPEFDAGLLPLSQLEAAAENPDWRAPGYADSRILLDKSGEIAAALERMGTLDEERARADTAGWLDAYLNAYYRSIKAARRGNRLGAHLQACESMPHLIRTLFALNGRLAPYLDRLPMNWHRLSLLPCPIDELIAAIERILTVADAREQIRLESMVEDLLRDEGYGKVFDDWGGDLEAARDAYLALRASS